MPNYRLYHVEQNRFVGVDDFHAVDDAQALRDSKPLKRTAEAELWEGGRKVRTIRRD
jgi:hypothetical protein